MQVDHSNTLVVVLGAHRSGTSLCAAALECLGADLAIEQQYVNAENPKGFFEQPDIVAFNDRLLGALGSSWDNPCFDGDKALTAFAERAEFESEALNLFDSLFRGKPLVAIKDPRFCQLLTFWLRVFARAGYSERQVRILHVIRDGFEVAQSQRRRAQKNPDYYELGTRLEEGAALWMSSVVQAFLASRGCLSLVVDAEQLQQNPRELVKEIGEFLGHSASPDAIDRFAQTFVDPQLFHRDVSPDDRASLSASFPGFVRFNEIIKRFLSGVDAVDFSRAESTDASLLSELVDVYESDEAQMAIYRHCASALGRLSKRARSDRGALHLLQAREADHLARYNQLQDRLDETVADYENSLSPMRAELESAREQTALWEKRFESTVEEYAAVEADLRSELNSIQSYLPVRALLAVRRRIRKAIDALRVARHQSQRRWRYLRRRAVIRYHWMSLSQPATAWTLRRFVRPFFHAMDRLVGVPRPLGAVVGGLSTTDTLRYQQAGLIEQSNPLVSVIVPNYNHAAFLRRRLESIYAQDYLNFEVILLDDASSDTSTDVLEEFLQRYPDKTRLEVSKTNSGSVFRQWQRGLELASGDLLWIAESDDWCSENFLSELVPYFQNEAIALAYARTIFMDRSGEKQTWSIEEYLHELGGSRWLDAFVDTGAEIVSQAFAQKNIIPNVSSVVFRAPRLLELWQEERWLNMRTCGDWMLYLHLLRGAMLAYTPTATNYYRMHESNTSVSSYTEDRYYKEHEEVALEARRYFDVPLERFEKLEQQLACHWRDTRSDFNQVDFKRCFDLERVCAVDDARPPNVLIASYGFCAGGGETFPVSLANIMKARGYNITYLDCAQQPRNEGVRARLRDDIPVVTQFLHLQQIVDAFDIDVIHSHHAWVEGTILDLLPEESEVSIVVTLHGMYETMNSYELKAILPRVMKRIDHFIYVAEKNLRALLQYGSVQQDRLARIDNALEDEPFDRIERCHLGIPEDAFVVSLVSRAMREKGWREAISAVELASKQSTREIHLLLVGDGPEYEALQGESLPANIHLMGFQRNVRGFFAVGDVGLLPSKFRGESSPLVIIECLQAGRPVIATDLGEVHSMLKGAEGLAGSVMPLNGSELDVQALATELCRLAMEPDYLRDLSSRVSEVAAKFDVAELASRHDAVYRLVRSRRIPA